jgi:hypothetical protein
VVKAVAVALHGMEASGMGSSPTRQQRAAAVVNLRSNHIFAKVAADVAKAIGDREGLAQVGVLFEDFDVDNSGSVSTTRHNLSYDT